MNPGRYPYPSLRFSPDSVSCFPRVEGVLADNKAHSVVIEAVDGVRVRSPGNP